MAKHVQRYRLPPSVAINYVGLEGELIVTKDDWTVRVHDGITPGGFEMLKASFVEGTYALLVDFNDLASAISAVGYSGVYADLTGKPTISTVGHTGNYSDLVGAPAGFDGSWTSLSGKPTFATVATSGAYNDLTGKPALFDGAYNSLTGKPSLFDGTYGALSGRPSIFDGVYDSLSGKPTLVAGNVYASQQTLAVGVLSFGHGLGITPSKLRSRLYLVCTSVDAGYAVGDVVEWGSTMPDNAQQITTVSHDAAGTTTRVVVGVGVNLAHKTTQANTPLIENKWDALLKLDYYP